MQTYLFYDIETSGLNKAFDQVFQFAAIRTDLQLNEIERYEYIVQRNPDTIPSPYASITHRISLSALENGLSEFEAMEKIHKIMNAPGTLSLGYNTLGFDDEFLRFSFYRNLLTPYTHQYANQCGRLDLYPMTIMYALYKPGNLHWPKQEGCASLKLENLSQANKPATGQAHNAMTDVEATLALAKHFIAEDDMWQYLLQYFNKQSDQERLLKLQKNQQGLHEGLLLLGKIGAKHNYQAPVVCLGEHKHYKNQTLWLRLDLPELRETTLDNITDKTWTFSKKYGEPGLLLPNSERFLEKIKQSRLEETERNKQWLSNNPDILAAIQAYYLNFTYPAHPATDVDAALYINPFWSRDDLILNQQFHQAAPETKIQVVEQMQNPDIQELALRTTARHWPSTLGNKQLEPFQEHIDKLAYINTAPEDFRGEKHMSKEQAQLDITTLREKNTLDATQLQLLDELEAL